MSEISAKNDIIEADFLDNYRNLTLKSRSALDFYVQFCQSEVLILLDDDITVQYITFFERKFGRCLKRG